MLRSIDDVRDEHLRSDPRKLLPTTIEFIREMRKISNFGRARRKQPEIPFTAADEERF